MRNVSAWRFNRVSYETLKEQVNTNNEIFKFRSIQPIEVFNELRHINRGKATGYDKIPPGPCGLREIGKFQGSLPGYQIIVIDFYARNASIYEGPREDKKIALYKHGDHYNVINPAKLPVFHGKRFFCEKCKSFFSNYSFHSCFDPCHTCLRKECFGWQMKNVLVLTAYVLTGKIS